MSKANDDSLGCGCAVFLLILLCSIGGQFFLPDTIRIQVPCVEIDQTQIYECAIK